MHTEKFMKLLRAEFGDKFHDVRHLMVRHRTNLPRTVDFNALTGIAVHHTAYHGLWKRAASYHVNDLGWPTIAYTVGVSFGRVFLLKNVEEMGYHAKGMNEKLLSVAVMGDLTKRKPYPEDIPMLEGVIRSYDALLGRQLKVLGHKDWLGQSTVCPGPKLAEWARNFERTPSATRVLDDEKMASAELPSTMSFYDISPTVLCCMDLRGDEPLADEQETGKYTFTLGKQGLYVLAKESDEVKVLSVEAA